MRNVVTICSATYTAILAATIGSAQAELTTLYENFGGDLFSVDLQTHTQLGHFTGAGVNLTAVNGHVYWQDGRRIYEANPELTNVNSIFFSVLTPTDFTLSPDGGTLYENFGGDLFSVDLQTHTQLGHFTGAGVNLTAVNGHVYWQDGRRIYEANPDLTNVNSIFFSVLTPTDFTLSPDGDTLYENFGGDLFSVDLQTHTQLGHFTAAGVNLTAVNGHVYWQDGRRIYEANPELTNVNSIFFSVLTPTDYTVEDLSSAVPELSSWMLMLLGFAGLGYKARVLRRGWSREVQSVFKGPFQGRPFV